MIRFSRVCLSLSFTLIIFVIGCTNRNKGLVSNIKVKKLHSYQLLKQGEKLLLGQPIRLKYDNDTGHLFIQDIAQRKVIEVDDESQIVNEFGGRGKGPGKVLSIENFFIISNYLFIVDGTQFLINKYNLSNGHYISSLNYHNLLLKTQLSSGSQVPYQYNYNKPFITRNGTILLPTETGRKSLYEIINWKGEKLGVIGGIPDKQAVLKNKDNYFSDSEEKSFLASHAADAFPVNDCLNPNNIYFVYPAIPKIAKYSLSGKELWEKRIPTTPEIDALLISLSDLLKKIKNHKGNHFTPALPLQTYVAGRCEPNGNIYLITSTNPTYPKKYRRAPWVHQFDLNGKLLERFKVGSDSMNAYYYPAIDYNKHRIFVPLLRSNNIRIYHF